MRKLLLVLCVCLFSVAAFAQDDNVFYKAPDTTEVKDSVPLFTRSCFGFYFMPASTFNSGTAVAPAPGNIEAGTTGSYFGNASEKSALGFSFGAVYESKPFAKRLFYSVGVEFADYRYTGNATLIVTGPGTYVAENVPYSWLALTLNVPIEIHCSIAQGKKYRVDVQTGVAPGLFISQSNTGQQSENNYDNFNPVTVWAMGGVGFEYYLGNSFIFRAEPCVDFSILHSQLKRQLTAEGLQIGLVFK